MKEISPLLEKLADKLGTTSEYLWKVLLKQAPISAAIDIVQYFLIAIAVIFWWKITSMVHRKIKGGNWDEGNYIWLSGVWVFLGIFVVALLFNLSNTITAIVNPEYWALDQILKTIK